MDTHQIITPVLHLLNTSLSLCLCVHVTHAVILSRRRCGLWGLFSLKNHFELSFVFILVTGVLINVTRLKLKLAFIYPLLLSNDCIHILLFCVLYFF